VQRCSYGVASPASLANRESWFRRKSRRPILHHAWPTVYSRGPRLSLTAPVALFVGALSAVCRSSQILAMGCPSPALLLLFPPTYAYGTRRKTLNSSQTSNTELHLHSTGHRTLVTTSTRQDQLDRTNSAGVHLTTVHHCDLECRLCSALPKPRRYLLACEWTHNLTTPTWFQHESMLAGSWT